MPEIFINYRTGDGEYFAAHLDEHLSRRFGSENVFRASKSIVPGQDFRHALQEASARTQVLLVVVGPSWLDPDEQGRCPLESDDNWTRKEILYAFHSGARVIPILCGRATPRLSPSKLPAGLAQLAAPQSLRFDTGSAEADLDAIAAVLTELVPGLTDQTRDASDAAGSTHNRIGGEAGVSIQARSLQTSGTIGRTVINGATGPVNSGSGDQNNGSTFHGSGSNYFEGGNSGGIHQSFGSPAEREDDR